MNLKENKKPMHIILEEVSKVTGVSKELIKSRIRMREAADARMLFCYMARKEGYLQREIGSFVGLCHSRVSAAYYDVKLGKGKFRPLIAKLSEGAEVSPENRKSMDVEDWIEDQSFVVVNPDLPVVGKSVALKVVRMAESRTVTKAVGILSSVLEGWMHGGDADCIVAEFEEKLGDALKKKTTGIKTDSV